MTDYGATVGGTSNSKILNVLNALKADGGGGWHPQILERNNGHTL